MYIKESIFREMGRLSASHNAINMAQGFPNFLPNLDTKSLCAHARNWQAHQYADPSGIPELKHAVSEMMNSLYNLDVDQEDNIVISSGATQAIFNTVNSIVENGEEVIILDPSFECYAPAVMFARGRVKRINLDDEGGVDWQRVRDAITSKTKLIIINNPHNPMGLCWSNNDISNLSNIVEANNIWVLSDEVYHTTVYEPLKHICLWENEILKERSVVVGSIGKVIGATGWRLGYSISPPFITKKIVGLQQYSTYSSNTLLQYAAADVLTTPDFFNDSRQFYQNLRDRFLFGIENSNFIFTPSQGTIFQVLDYTNISNKNGCDFSLELLVNFGIACLPISAFMDEDRGVKKVRVCFAKSEKVLSQAVNILRGL